MKDPTSPGWTRRKFNRAGLAALGLVVTGPSVALADDKPLVACTISAEPSPQRLHIKITLKNLTKQSLGLVHTHGQPQLPNPGAVLTVGKGELELDLQPPPGYRRPMTRRAPPQMTVALPPGRPVQVQHVDYAWPEACFKAAPQLVGRPASVQCTLNVPVALPDKSQKAQSNLQSNAVAFKLPPRFVATDATDQP